MLIAFFKLLLLGVVGGTAFALAWVAFFTFIVYWPGHDMFSTVFFLVGALVAILVGLRWATG